MAAINVSRVITNISTVSQAEIPGPGTARRFLDRAWRGCELVIWVHLSVYEASRNMPPLTGLLRCIYGVFYRDITPDGACRWQLRLFKKAVRTP